MHYPVMVSTRNVTYPLKSLQWFKAVYNWTEHVDVMHSQCQSHYIQFSTDILIKFCWKTKQSLKIEAFKGDQIIQNYLVPHYRSIFEAKWNDESRLFARRAATLLVSVSKLFKIPAQFSIFPPKANTHLPKVKHLHKETRKRARAHREKSHRRDSRSDRREPQINAATVRGWGRRDKDFSLSLAQDVSLYVYAFVTRPDKSH